MPTKTVSPSSSARNSTRLSQHKLDGILKGTRQPRKQEKGRQHFAVVVPKPQPQTKDRFALVFTLATITIVTGLIALNIFGWPLLDKVASR